MAELFKADISVTVERLNSYDHKLTISSQDRTIVRHSKELFTEAEVKELTLKAVSSLLSSYAELEGEEEEPTQALTSYNGLDYTVWK
jgi:hypothetical protein